MSGTKLSVTYALTKKNDDTELRTYSTEYTKRVTYKGAVRSAKMEIQYILLQAVASGNYTGGCILDNTWNVINTK